MTATFKPARRENVPLLIGLEGASGSGKTYSALQLAAGIADEIGQARGGEAKICFIDTERGRGLHYADSFNYLHAEIRPPFSPAAYGDAIRAAEAAGADVIIIDSFSHEWEGEGGVREWAERLEAGVPKAGVANPRTWGDNWKQDWQTPPVKSPSNWIEPKTAHKRLVNQMLAARAHIIVCLRSEEKMKVEQVDEKGSNGRTYKKTVITAPGDMPITDRWVPICEKRFPFEITTSLLLIPQQPGVPIARKLQEQHRPYFPDDRRIGREAGAGLARWSMGGAAVPSPPNPGGTVDFSAQLASLKAIARPGNMEALQAAWADIGAPARKALAGELEGLKASCAPAAPSAPPQQQEGTNNGYDGV